MKAEEQNEIIKIQRVARLQDEAIKSLEGQVKRLGEQQLRSRIEFASVLTRQIQNSNEEIDQLRCLAMVAGSRHNAIEHAVCRLGAKVDNRDSSEVRDELIREFQDQYDRVLLKLGKTRDQVVGILEMRDLDGSGQN
jgi:hypothetical protein